MQQNDNNYPLRKEFYDNFKKVSCHKKESPTQDVIDFYIQKIKDIEELSFESKRFFFLLDHCKYSPVYISKNLESESGYSLQLLKDESLLFIFRKIHMVQLNMPSEVYNFGSKILEKHGHLYKPRCVKMNLCGIKVKDKWGKWRTMMFSQRVLIFSKNNNPLLSYLEAEEISAFHQSNAWWYRIEIETGTSSPITKVHFSNGQKKETNKLLSKRELEILKLSAEKKTNIKIANSLGITKNTVERHRKNMLAKVGVINMSGLLRIAQILNLV